MSDCIAVAEKLAKEEISVEIADLQTKSPLDMDTVLSSVAKTRRAVTVHEAVTSFGVGVEIAARIYKELFGLLASPIERVGAAYCPVPFSKPLEIAFMPNQEKIEAAIRLSLG